MQRVTMHNGLSLSRLIYGMWRLADDDDQSASYVQAKIEACLEQGITGMDQADIYGDYGAEEILEMPCGQHRICATGSRLSPNAISLPQPGGTAGHGSNIMIPARHISPPLLRIACA